jgi:hypothetical protein
MPLARKGMTRNRHGYVGHRVSASNHSVDFWARLPTGYSHLIPDLLTGIEDASLNPVLYLNSQTRASLVPIHGIGKAPEHSSTKWCALLHRHRREITPQAPQLSPLIESRVDRSDFAIGIEDGAGNRVIDVDLS